MAAVTIGHARANLGALVRRVNEDHDAVEIVAEGGNAVLMSAEDYEAMRETLYLFSTPADARHILGALDEVRDGTTQASGIEDLVRWLGVGISDETGETP
jgi:antitoxin YefM